MCVNVGRPIRKRTGWGSYRGRYPQVARVGKASGPELS